MDKIDHCDSDDPSHCKWENFSLCSTHKNQSILNLELLETKKVLYLPSDFKSKVKESIASRLATISSGITKLEEKKNLGIPLRKNPHFSNDSLITVCC